MEKARSSLPPFMNRTSARKSGVPASAADKAKKAEAAPAPANPRNAYQQRIDQLKIRIAEISLRNMENTLRILRTCMKEK